jgi:23S rRNA (guanine745-N1)-methyltransferase
LLDVFAPRNAPEFARVLASDGTLVVVTPTARHLAELVETLRLLTVDDRKEERLEEQLGELFEPVTVVEHDETIRLTSAQVADLAGMGPSARHVRDETAETLERVTEPLDVTASVLVSAYRRRGMS